MSIEAHKLNSFIVGTLIVHIQRMNKNMEGGRCTIGSLQGLVIRPFSSCHILSRQDTNRS